MYNPTPTTAQPTILTVNGPNEFLPTANPLRVRSTWLTIITVILGALNAYNVDLGSALSGMGVGGDPEEIVQTGERAVAAWQVLLTIVTGIWAWWERKAPNYRLSFRRMFGQH